MTFHCKICGCVIIAMGFWDVETGYMVLCTSCKAIYRISVDLAQESPLSKEELKLRLNRNS